MMLPFATNFPRGLVPQSPPPIMTSLGVLSPTAFQTASAVTSPASTSTQAFNQQASQQTQNTAPPIVVTGLPAGGGNIVSASSFVPVDDGLIMGISPLGWGAILVGTFFAYKAFFAPKS